MTTALTAAYRVEPDPYWAIAQMRGEDGYDRIAGARRFGWEAIPSWGSRGWDLGSWPLVAIFWRRRAGMFELCENVEGDATCYAFPTAELREQATDEMAFFHWHHEREPWLEGAESVEAMPAALRGPYRQ